MGAADANLNGRIIYSELTRSAQKAPIRACRKADFPPNQSRLEYIDFIAIFKTIDSAGAGDWER
jgi:hypothetical protein